MMVPGCGPLNQSSWARDGSLLGKLPFQELFAKRAVQFLSFKVTLCCGEATWAKGDFFFFKAKPVI